VLASESTLQISGGREEAALFYVRNFPTAIVRAKLNGQTCLLAVDTGTNDFLLDEGWSRRTNVRMISGEWTTLWNGGQVVVKGAIAQRVDLGGFRIENVPAGRLDLSRWSIEVNPQGEKVAGVIGLRVLRKLGATLDLEKNRLVLRRDPSKWSAPAKAARVPFEVWGDGEIMVRGSIAGGRKMAFVLQTGLPGCGIAAPAEVFDEVGVKPGGLSKMVKSVGSMIQGRAWTAVNVPTVSVGSMVRDRVPGWSDAMDSYELWRHGVRRDAVLAGEFFRKRALTIDWAKRELVVSSEK
jgi:hypothetical protein